jgi:hypothetical protein
MLSDYSGISKLPYLNATERPRETRSISFRKSQNKSFCLSLRRKPKSISVISDQPSSSSDATDKKNYLTIEQLKDFLQSEQHMGTLSIEDCSKLIGKFEPSSEGLKYEELGVEGLRLLLLHDEFCIMNTNKTLQIYHDMTRPITDYFIATSHNT